MKYISDKIILSLLTIYYFCINTNVLAIQDNDIDNIDKCSSNTNKEEYKVVSTKENCEVMENVDSKTQLNSLFMEVVKRFKKIPQSHILKQLEPIPTLDINIGKNYKLYSAYGVYFPKDFKIDAHKDYQCSLCNGDFKALMIPKYINPEMAQICFKEECENATKGYYLVNVCKDHWTKPGIIDRIQINIYYTNSTKCTPLGKLDEFDCEAMNFGSVKDFKHLCTTTHPFLAPLVEQRDLHWND